MRVVDVMTGTPYFCAPEANLGIATELMWTGNCGFLPVVESAGKVVGVVTDRDICIALGTRGQPAGDVPVGEVMTQKVYFCSPADDIHAALNTMSERRVRRLPVLAKDGILVGVVSMDDVILHAELGILGKTPDLSLQEVLKTLQAINVRELPEIIAKEAAA